MFGRKKCIFFFYRAIKEKNPTILDRKHRNADLYEEFQEREMREVRSRGTTRGFCTSHHSKGNACKSQLYFVQTLELLLLFCKCVCFSTKQSNFCLEIDHQSESIKSIIRPLKLNSLLPPLQKRSGGGVPTTFYHFPSLCRDFSNT